MEGAPRGDQAAEVAEEPALASDVEPLDEPPSDVAEEEPESLFASLLPFELDEDEVEDEPLERLSVR